MFGLREENFDQPNAAGIPDERVRKSSPCGLLLPSPREKTEKGGRALLCLPLSQTFGRPAGAGKLELLNY